jgi:hypothetical protein
MDLFNFIKNFDYLAPSQVLYIKGHKSFQTYIGAILSLLVFGLVFALGIYFFYKLISRENLYISIQEESHQINFTFNFSNSLFAFKINSDIELNENEIVFIVSYNELDLYNIKKKKLNLEIEKCKEEKIDKSIKEIDKIKNISSFYCLVPSENAQIKTILNKGIDSFLNIEIYLCDNEKNSSCKSNEEIINKLKGHLMEFYFITQTYYVNNYNYKNPLLKSYEEEKIKLNLETITNITYFYEQLSYYSDNGIIFEEKKKYKGFIFPTKTRYSINIRNNFKNPLGSFLFYINRNQRQRYERKYQKLQEICAYIGGILSFLNFIGSFIVSAYNEQFFFYYIINWIFNDRKESIKGNIFHSALFPENYYKQSFNKNSNSSQIIFKQGNYGNQMIKLNRTPQQSKKNNIHIIKKNIDDNLGNLNKSNLNPSNINFSYNNKVNNKISNTYITQFHHKKIKSMLNIPKLKLFDLLCTVCFIDNPKAQFLNNCQELVFNTLSCEDIIKNSINFEKIIQICDFNEKEEYLSFFPIQLQDYINKDYITLSFHRLKSEG